jgi:23S rRNA (pseudouridine1915-N3)-methyltransferase
MHIRLIAVGDRQPSWVDAAFDNYAQRLPRQWRFGIDVIATAARQKKASSEAAIATEGERVLARIRPEEQAVILDERGREYSSTELAAALSAWQADGRDLVFVIGGPDGVSQALGKRADLCWSLSRLTLPHGLARVLFAEQLYRAWSLTAGHPYHRE